MTGSPKLNPRVSSPNVQETKPPAASKPQSPAKASKRLNADDISTLAYKKAKSPAKVTPAAPTAPTPDELAKEAKAKEAAEAQAEEDAAAAAFAKV